MPTKSCSDREVGSAATVDGLTLSWSIDWPIERVVIDVEVLVTRRLGALEWALLRILSDLVDDEPSLEEAATELGVHDPLFLRETLDQLIDMGLVEVQKDSKPVELAYCRVSKVGQTFLSNDQPAPLPECHGFLVHFDAVTGEAITNASNRMRDRAYRPIILPHKLSPLREDVGLDRVRLLTKEEPWTKDGARISRASVQTDQGGYFWQPTTASIRLASIAGVQFELPNASAAQRQWVNGAGRNAIKTLWDRTLPNWVKATRIPPFPDWREQAQQIVAPDRWRNHAEGLIKNAKNEIVINARWLSARGLGDLLHQAAARGVRCFVCGTSPSLTGWKDGSMQPPGFVAGGGAPAPMRPVAVIADEQGICIGRFTTTNESLGEFIIAAVLKDGTVSTTRTELMDGLTADLAQDDERQLFAAFAATGDFEQWQRGIMLVAAGLEGLSRIESLHRWGAWGKAVARNGAPDAGWFAAATEAWWSEFELTGEDDGADSLLELAVHLIPPEEILPAMSALVTAECVRKDSEPLRALIAHAIAVRRLWPRFDPVKQCPTWLKQVRACLQGQEPERLPSSVEEAVRVLSVSSDFATSRAFWMTALSSAVPKSHDLRSLVVWLQAHLLLKEISKSHVRSSAEEQLKQISLVTQSPTELIDQMRTVWNKLGLSPELLNRFIKPEVGRSNITLRRRAGS